MPTPMFVDDYMALGSSLEVDNTNLKMNMNMNNGTIGSRIISGGGSPINFKEAMLMMKMNPPQPAPIRPAIPSSVFVRNNKQKSNPRNKRIHQQQQQQKQNGGYSNFSNINSIRKNNKSNGSKNKFRDGYNNSNSSSSSTSNHNNYNIMGRMGVNMMNMNDKMDVSLPVGGGNGSDNMNNNYNSLHRLHQGSHFDHHHHVDIKASLEEPSLGMNSLAHIKSSADTNTPIADIGVLYKQLRIQTDNITKEMKKQSKYQALIRSNRDPKFMYFSDYIPFNAEIHETSYNNNNDDPGSSSSNTSTSSDPFCIAQGVVGDENRAISFNVSEVYGVCFLINLSVILPQTAQAWTVFVPSSEESRQVLRLWTNSPSHSSTKGKSPKVSITAWLLQHLLIKFGNNNEIMGASFDMNIYLKICRHEIDIIVIKSIICIQAIIRGYLARKLFKNLLVRREKIRKSIQIARKRVRDHNRTHGGPALGMDGQNDLQSLSSFSSLDLNGQGYLSNPSGHSNYNYKSNNGGADGTGSKNNIDNIDPSDVMRELSILDSFDSAVLGLEGDLNNLQQELLQIGQGYRDGGYTDAEEKELRAIMNYKSNNQRDHHNNNNNGFVSNISSNSHSNVSKPLGVPTHIARKRQYVPFQTGLINPTDIDNMHNDNSSNNSQLKEVKRTSGNQALEKNNNGHDGFGNNGLGDLSHYLDKDGDVDIPLSPIVSPVRHVNHQQQPETSSSTSNMSTNAMNIEAPVLSSSTSFKGKDLRRSFAQFPINRIGEDGRSHSQYIREREASLGIDNNNISNTSDNAGISNDTKSSTSNHHHVNDDTEQGEDSTAISVTEPNQSINPRVKVRKSIFSRGIVAAHKNGKIDSNSNNNSKGKRKQSILGAIFGYGAPKSPVSNTTTAAANSNDDNLQITVVKEDEGDNDNTIHSDNMDISSAISSPTLPASPVPHTSTNASSSDSVPNLDLNINAYSSPSQMAGILGDNMNVNMNMNGNMNYLGGLGGDDSPSNQTRVSQETVSSITTARTNRPSIVDGLSRILGFKSKDQRPAGLINALKNVPEDAYTGGTSNPSSVSVGTGMYSFNESSNINTSNAISTQTSSGPSRLMLNTTDPLLLSPKDQITTIKAKAQAETWQVKKQLARDEKQRIEDEEKRKVMERRFVMEERQKQKVEAEEMKRLKAIEDEAAKRKEFADRVTKKRLEEEYAEWNRRQTKYERIAEKTKQEEIRSKKIAERNEAKRKQIQEEEKEKQKQLRLKAKAEIEAEKIRLMSFEEKREYEAKKAAKEKEEAAIAAAIAAEEEKKRLEEEKIRLEEEERLAKEAAILAEEERIRLEKEAEEERIRLEKEAEEERIRLEKEAEEERIRTELKEKEDRKLRMELAAQERERKIMAREDAIASSIRAYYTPKISSDAAKAVLTRVVKRFKEGSTRKKRELTFGRDWIKMHGLLSIISNTDDYRNIADAIDMANYHSNSDLANLVSKRLNSKLFVEEMLSIPPHENKDLTELLQYTSIPKIHGFMNTFINEKIIIYNFIDLLMLLTDYSVSCMEQMAEDNLIGTLLDIALAAPERIKTDAAIKIAKIISRVAQDSATGKSFMCEPESATKLSQMILKSMGSDAWTESVLKILFYISFKNKSKLYQIGRAGCVDAVLQVMAASTKKSKICASALKCVIALTQGDENNATIALSPTRISNIISTVTDLNNNKKLLVQLLTLICAYGRATETFRNILGATELPTSLINIAIKPNQDPDLVPVIIQTLAYIIPLSATDIMDNITSLINVFESNQSATKEQMDNIGLAKSVLGARFSGEKDLRIVKKRRDSVKSKGEKKKKKNDATEN